MRVPDRLVLLALDGRDDVVHVVVTGPAQRRHERAAADRRQGQPLGGLSVEHLVVDVEHPVAARGDDPAPGDPLRPPLGCGVERGGGGRPPVDDEHVAVGGADADPADPQLLTLGRVQPAEHQPVGLQLEHPQPLADAVDHHVALVDRARVVLVDRDQLLVPYDGRLAAQLVDPRGHDVDVRLLDGDLTVAFRGPLGRRRQDGAGRVVMLRVSRDHAHPSGGVLGVSAASLWDRPTSLPGAGGFGEPDTRTVGARLSPDSQSGR